MSEVYSRAEMMDAIRGFLQVEGYTLASPYDKIFEPARVPVFGYKQEKHDESIFVDIITEARIRTKNYFQTRTFPRSLSGLTIKNANSAEFFRHYFPDSSIYWAFPAYAERGRDFDQFLLQCRNGGIGLIEVARTEANKYKVSKLYEARSLSNDRLSEIVTFITDCGNSELTRNELSKLRKILNEHIEEDIKYLVFYPEPKYLAADVSIRDEARNISTQLINRMGELKNVSYRGILSRFAETYYGAIEDDYSIALKVTEGIWKRYGIQYPKLHRDFEEVLKLDSRYRDHFLHAFQVFLFGVYVIDQLYSEFPMGKFGFGKKTGDKIEDAWAIAATYHDYNYMIQNFDEWTKNFLPKHYISIHVIPIQPPCALASHTSKAATC